MWKPLGLLSSPPLWPEPFTTTCPGSGRGQLAGRQLRLGGNVSRAGSGVCSLSFDSPSFFALRHPGQGSGFGASCPSRGAACKDRGSAWGLCLGRRCLQRGAGFGPLGTGPRSDVCEASQEPLSQRSCGVVAPRRAPGPFNSAWLGAVTLGFGPRVSPPLTRPARRLCGGTRTSGERGRPLRYYGGLGPFHLRLYWTRHTSHALLGGATGEETSAK